MNKNLLKLATLSAVFVIGVGVSFNATTTAKAVFATQHEDNYQDYKYSGSYYSPLAAYDSVATDGLNGTLRQLISLTPISSKFFLKSA